MLNNLTLFGEQDKVKIAIERIQHYEKFTAGGGYYLADSGGKDSCTIKALADMAGVKYDAHYNLTTVDPPELVQFIKREHPDTIIDRPEEPLLSRMVYKGYPSGQARWCCAEYKERGGDGRIVITGVRHAESKKREKRRMFEPCEKNERKLFLHPIIDWDDNDVWTFIRYNNIPYCKLYDEGWKRVGCLFCPNAGKMRKLHAERYPKIRDAFIRAFQRLYDKKESEGKETFWRFKNGEEAFWWWLSHTPKGNKNQCTIFE